MKITTLIDNWPKAIALTAMTALLFWGYGCPPKTESLVDPAKKVTFAELQIELDSITATATYRIADLEKQQAFRDVIFQNALLVVENGTLNPIGVITLLTSLYGVTRGVKDAKDKIVAKRKEKPPSTQPTSSTLVG